MARLTRLVPVLTAVALLVLAVAPPARAQAPRRGGVFRVPVPEAPTLDPHQNAGFVAHLYATLGYGQLVGFPSRPEAQGGANHRILPDIAEKWEFPTPITRSSGTSPTRRTTSGCRWGRATSRTPPP
jgi:ABC-type transport system substrate-binding protein